MPDRRIPFEMPLLLAGITDRTEESLRLAGVPVARLADGMFGGLGRFVLFDSRISSPCLDRQAAKAAGLTPIDVAALGSHAGGLFVVGGRAAKRIDPGNERAEDLEFLVRLKQEIERAGGVWLRIAEFPFPYQYVLCDDGGHELRISDLYWRATRNELARWQTVRRNLAVLAQRQGDRYHIDFDGELDGFRPALELWRDRHVATLPLFPGGMCVRESGLVFQRDARRHPAGCCTNWMDDVIQRNANKHVQRESA